jgi:hypothetical protein
MSLPMVVTSSSQLAVPRGLMAAMDPYRLAAPLSAAFDQVDGEELRDLVRTNRFGDLWTSWHADGDPLDLWRYADQAASYLQRLPALPDVEAARHVLRTDIETEPMIEALYDLVCAMLDAANVTATSTYIETLIWKLGNSPRRPTETHPRIKPWFPLAAIAATVDDVVTNVRPQHGRPVSIVEVLDIAGRHASELIRLEAALDTMSKAIQLLGRVTQAVSDVPRPPSLKPLGWQPPRMGPDEEPLPF